MGKWFRGGLLSVAALLGYDVATDVVTGEVADTRAAFSGKSLSAEDKGPMWRGIGTAVKVASLTAVLLAAHWAPTKPTPWPQDRAPIYAQAEDRAEWALAAAQNLDREVSETVPLPDDFPGELPPEEIAELFNDHRSDFMVLLTPQIQEKTHGFADLRAVKFRESNGQVTVDLTFHVPPSKTFDHTIDAIKTQLKNVAGMLLREKFRAINLELAQSAHRPEKHRVVITRVMRRQVKEIFG